MFADGALQADVVRALGVSKATASQWHRVWQESGTLEPGRRGQKARLNDEQSDEIRDVLLSSPRDVGMSVDEWSLAAVAALIEQRTGVRYHHRHVGRLLGRLGWIVSPVGRHSGAALLARPIDDLDGNAIWLLQRRRVHGEEHGEG